MANFDGSIDPAAEWADVPQLSDTAVALGGAGGPMNAQAVAITARLKFLEASKASNAALAAIDAAKASNASVSTLSGVVDTKASASDLSSLTTVVSGKASNSDLTAGLLAKVSLTALAAAVGSALMGFIQAGTGAVSRTAQDKMREWVTVKDFGAVGDGSTDDTLAIQAAINYRAANGGGIVFMPKGTYKVTAPIIWTANNVHLVGSGIGATAISATFAAGDVITVGDGTANPNNCIVRDLSITSTVAKTSGAGIRLRNGHNLQVRNIRMDANLFKGIALDGGPQHFIYFLDTLEISGCIDNGIDVGSDGTQVADCFITNAVIGGSPRGIVMRFVSGMYMSKVDAISCSDYGIGMIPGNGQSVASSFFDTVLGDTCGNQGWRITPTGTGKVTDISFQNCWASSTVNTGGSTAGIYIDGPSANQVSNLNFTTFRAVNNKGSGYLLAQGKFLTFANCVASGNSMVGSNGAPGFNIIGNLTDIQIFGGVYGGYNGLPNFQSYGIAFAGTCNYIQIIGANTRGNVSGGIINASSGVNNVVVSNV